MTHILDAGPLIAALNRNDRHHRWARETIARLGTPFHSCPEAMAEASAMTGRPAAIVEMFQAGEIVLSFLAEQAASVLVLLRKYADRDMDLADAVHPAHDGTGEGPSRRHARSPGLLRVSAQRA